MLKSKSGQYRSSTNVSMVEEIKVVVVGKSIDRIQTNNDAMILNNCLYFWILGDGYTGKVWTRRSTKSDVFSILSSSFFLTRQPFVSSIRMDNIHKIHTFRQFSKTMQVLLKTSMISFLSIQNIFIYSDSDIK